MEKVINIATDCLERVWPDMTIILDVDLQTASGRLNRQLDRMEQKGDSYHQRVRDGFLELAKQQENFLVVNAAADIETVQNNILQLISEVSYP
jgi:dTMP kinase